MNHKRFWLAVATVFVAANIFGMIIHGTLLFDDYSALPNLMRSPEEANAYIPYMMMGVASFSLAMVWIYTHGVTNKPWLAQGVRFGIAVFFLTAFPMFLTYYFVSPYPPMVVLKQISFEFIAKTILGIITAAIYRHEL